LCTQPRGAWCTYVSTPMDAKTHDNAQLGTCVLQRQVHLATSTEGPPVCRHRRRLAHGTPTNVRAYICIRTTCLQRPQTHGPLSGLYRQVLLTDKTVHLHLKVTSTEWPCAFSDYRKLTQLPLQWQLCMSLWDQTYWSTLVHVCTQGHVHMLKKKKHKSSSFYTSSYRKEGLGSWNKISQEPLEVHLTGKDSWHSAHHIKGKVI
jgi:hypothetical protein